MRLAFEKVHGLGNDFVLLDARTGGSTCGPAEVRRLCDRRLGVGADGVLTLLPAGHPDAAARLLVQNADGSEAELCGNGLRCAARVLLDESGEARVAIETAAGLLHCEASGEGIRAEIGRPVVGDPVELSFEGGRISGRPVSIGNPHFVVFGRADREAAAHLGPALENHARFAPARTNVELCERADGGLRVAVWERGCGLTPACGTGASAAVAAAAYEGLVTPGREITVELPGGRLHVRIGPDGSATLRGPAVRVFTGRVDLP